MPKFSGLIVAVILVVNLAACHSRAQTQGQSTPKLIVLLPPSFKGWACVKFGVGGAPRLAREGDAPVVRFRPGEITQTSDEPPKMFVGYSESYLEVDGKRQSLPHNEFDQRRSLFRDENGTQSYCAFYGTIDEGELAGAPPGFPASPAENAGVSHVERQALIALYRATGGDQWTHHVGWLGPPGTECNWHGVECWSNLNPKPQQVTGINLMENNLVGSVPESIGQLTHLTDLDLPGNHLSGRLPQPLIQQWLAGSLRVVGPASLLTDISKIEYEVDPSALLCGLRRIEIGADGHVVQYEKRCRNAMPGDRTTYCEMKEGKIWGNEFATLAWLLEKNGFFKLKPKYSGNVTDAAFFTVRATKRGSVKSVELYAWGAPFEFSVIQLAIDGFGARSVEWDKTRTRPQCPASLAQRK